MKPLLVRCGPVCSIAPKLRLHKTRRRRSTPYNIGLTRDSPLPTRDRLRAALLRRSYFDRPIPRRRAADKPKAKAKSEFSLTEQQ